MNPFRDHPLAGFYLLAVLMVVVLMAIALTLIRRDESRGRFLAELFEHCRRDRIPMNAVSIARFARGQPMALIVLLFASAPTLAALVTAGIGDGRQGLGDVGSRLRPWRDGITPARGVAVYAGIAAVYLLVAAWYLSTTKRRGTDEEREQQWAILGGNRSRAARRLAVGPFVDEGGTLEEVGWRGYALPVLIAGGAGEWWATVVLGALWWAWHLPREVPTLLAGPKWTEFARNQAVFLLLTISMSVVITWLWLRTGGSVWPAILVHGGTNVWSKTLGVAVARIFPGVDVRTVIVVALAVILFVLR